MEMARTDSASAPASDSMCPASARRASELAMRPPTTSATMYVATRTIVMVRRLALVSGAAWPWPCWWPWPWAGSSCGWSCRTVQDDGRVAGRRQGASCVRPGARRNARILTPRSDDRPSRERGPVGPHRPVCYGRGMRAVRCHELVGPRGLRVDEVPDPAPAAGQVLIDVRAAGVNFPDLLLCRGAYQFKPQPPFSPGAEAAGTVAALGPGVSSVAVGDRVAATVIHGAFAERLVVPELSAVKIPDAVSTEVGAA